MAIDNDFFPKPEQPNIRSNQVCYVLIQPNETIIGYLDLTSRFPKWFSRGNEYIMIGYHYDTNCILATPLKNRKGSTIAEA